MPDNLPPVITQLPIHEDLFTGIDVGGTKVHIADSLSSTLKRYSTSDYESMEAILDNYFHIKGGRSAKVAIGMAGPRDDETGEIKLTNSNWPAFNPQTATAKYGIEYITVNDMVATSAGVLVETGVDLHTLKSGTPTGTGTKLVVSISTGIGVGAAVWDNRSKRFVIIASEGGHISIQPKNEEEQRYLNYLQKKYPHATAELAVSGKHGIGNLIEHAFENVVAPNLTNAIDRAKTDNRPIGAVLIEFATQGEGVDQEVARSILEKLGAMIGSMLRDLTVTFKANGGVYLTGSVALALVEYLAFYTTMKDRFILKGAVHDTWLENVPINLVTNPNVAVLGALELAKDGFDFHKSY